MSPEGIVVVDKPAGMTSHDVVDEVRRRLHTRRVGHGGTLDPDATGVLVVGVGRATRLLSYAQAAPKRYTATAYLGVVTDTQDASGAVIARSEVEVTREELAAALERFAGEIEQVPPMTSAVRVGGERLYARARRGEEVERSPRRVTIHRLELVAYEPPRATLDVTCSGGTYIRTLIHDLGRVLGCGAHMASLVRTEAGGFSLADAVALDDVRPSALRPAIDAVGHLPRIELGPADAGAVAHGRPLPAPGDVAEDQAVAVTAGGALVAVCRRRGSRLQPERVLAAPA